MRTILKKMTRPLFPALDTGRRIALGIPGVGRVDFGSLRSTVPVSRKFGVDRGLPIDRFYIEAFLEQHRNDVRGQVLEIGERTYTERYGGERVSGSDILHVSKENPSVTIVADLADAPQIPDGRFDAIILTQTLQLIFDPPSAVGTLYRILRPGGVLLLTVPGITPVASRSQWGATWYWSFTRLAVERLLQGPFAGSDVTVTNQGNVLASVAFLHGLAAGELEPAELAVVDPDYPVIVAARARRPEAG